MDRKTTEFWKTLSVNTLMGIWHDLLEAQNRTKQALESNRTDIDRGFAQRRIESYQEDIDAVKFLIEEKKKQGSFE